VALSGDCTCGEYGLCGICSPSRRGVRAEPGSEKGDPGGMLMRRGRISDLELSILAAAAVMVSWRDGSILTAGSVGLDVVLDENDDMEAGDSGRTASDFRPSQELGVELAVLLAVVEDPDDETEVVDGVESRVGLLAGAGVSSGTAVLSSTAASVFFLAGGASGFCTGASGVSCLVVSCFSGAAASGLATVGGCSAAEGGALQTVGDLARKSR
jgi:hypothetical protein